MRYVQRSVYKIMIKIFGIVLISLLFSQTLKHMRPDHSSYVGLACSMALLIMGLDEIRPFVSFFGQLVSDTEHFEYVSLVSKALGIAIVCESASEMCKGMGENQLASGVELIGKCEIMALALPIVKDVTEILGENLL